MQKIASKYKLIVTALFLACFACASISLAVHSFSHKISFLQKSDEEILIKSAESNSSFINFFKGFSRNHNAPSGDLSHCSLCFLSGFHNNAIFAAAIVFAAMSFHLFLTWRKLSRTKLAYLSSSFSSRAPPFCFLNFYLINLLRNKILKHEKIPIFRLAIGAIICIGGNFFANGKSSQCRA